MRRSTLVGLGLIGLCVFAFVQVVSGRSKPIDTVGRLQAMDEAGKSLGDCPLKHTDVSVEISGMVARTTVRQKFHNPFEQKIEAVYIFPLSADGVVDRMTMVIGKRRIRGEIRDRDEARVTYESAKAAGKVASLLEQQRPNIFTQSVANIEPGVEIDITISYCETLKWVDGEYHFAFPMTVAPRYFPGKGGDAPADGAANPPAPIANADRMTPPLAPEGTRAGHDLSLTVMLNAGIPIQRLESRQHEIDVQFSAADKSRAVVKLKNRSTIPNKDFVLVYQTAGDTISDTFLAHTDRRGKFFTLVLQPPKRVQPKAVVPKEILFAIDKSGSMAGFPIETAKRAMRACIEGAHEDDTFNLICFEGGTSCCFPTPVPNTAENRRVALDYLDRLSGEGGTEMMKAIDACLAGSTGSDRLRVVCFMTDGLVGNDMAIIDAVRRHAGTTRVFAFGIGSSVNRYLLDGMARAGRGEVHYVLNESEAAGAAEKFHQRIRTPVLADVRVDFGQAVVEDIYPKTVLDLFSAKPIVICGRYTGAGPTTITLSGRTGEGRFERRVDVQLPADEPGNEVLASLWAGAKVAELVDQDLAGVQNGTPDGAIKREVVAIGIAYQLLTPFTSFVAVDERTDTGAAAPRKIGVPVESPGSGDDISYSCAATSVPRDLERFEVGETPIDSAELSTDTLTMNETYVAGVWPAGHALAPGLGEVTDWTPVPSSQERRGGIACGACAGTWHVASQEYFGRVAATKRMMLGSFGGTKQSERAASAALSWFARHQWDDGHWQFDPPVDAKRAFDNTGTWNSPTAATSLALLTFLAAGQTHESRGPYKGTVHYGMYWLVRRQIRNGNFAHECELPMISHAMATIASSESYGITGDKVLGAAATAAVEFIVASQDTDTGGWGEPDEPPSLAVSVWQIMALRSAALAGLSVPEDCLKKATHYLDSLEASDHVRFSDVQASDPSDSATARGVLARLQLSRKWQPNRIDQDDDAAIASKFAESVRWWRAKEPFTNDATANFFATTFLHDLPGPEWDAWNRAVRRSLIESQIKLDAPTGSWWNPNDVQAKLGGRLYVTAMNCLTLEVYYRYLPLYGARAVTVTPAPDKMPPLPPK